jgi:hypothetical protein
MWTQVLPLTPEGNVAVDTAMPVLSPDLIFVFGQTDLFAQSHGPIWLKTAYPGAHVVGCSTGTSITGNTLSDEGLTAVAVGFEHTKLRSAAVSLGDGTSCRDAGISLGRQLAREDLRAVFLLSDGQDINASELVAGLVGSVGGDVKVSGGLAGDGARFGQTLVLHDGEPVDRIVTALGFYGGHLRIGQGSAGGWDVFGPRRHITRSKGNVLYELDGKPALDLYERYLGEEAADLPASGLYYPLKISDPARPNEKVMRTILSVDHAARSLTFAGDVPEGWTARLMQGEFDHLVQGAQEAAEYALGALQAGDETIQPNLSLLISCVGRRLLMGQRTSEEVRAVSRVLGPQSRQIGFYSYGEIAPRNGSDLSLLHNQTVTLTLLAEVA